MEWCASPDHVSKLSSDGGFGMNGQLEEHDLGSRLMPFLYLTNVLNESMSHVSSVFAALSDPYRLDIIETLMRDGETPAGAISDRFEISGPAVSRHLSILLQAGLVNRKVAGKQRLYSVRPEAIRQISNWALDHRRFWEAGMNRIEAALQEDSDA